MKPLPLPLVLTIEEANSIYVYALTRDESCLNSLTPAVITWAKNAASTPEKCLRNFLIKSPE
jgi:hypothetical protein